MCWRRQGSGTWPNTTTITTTTAITNTITNTTNHQGTASMEPAGLRRRPAGSGVCRRAPRSPRAPRLAPAGCCPTCGPGSKRWGSSLSPPPRIYVISLVATITLVATPPRLVPAVCCWLFVPPRALPQCMSSLRLRVCCQQHIVPRCVAGCVRAAALEQVAGGHVLEEVDDRHRVPAVRRGTKEMSGPVVSTCAASL